MYSRMLFGLGGFALGVSSAVSAQDSAADPTYGTVDLEIAFEPDPYQISVAAGGSINASNIGSPCTGMIANAPDIRLYYDDYDAGVPLIIFVDSTSDSTLVVNAPDGRWYCDDDSGEGLNPSVSFGEPMSGRYEIWVGTYSGTDHPSATVNISEVW